MKCFVCGRSGYWSSKIPLNSRIKLYQRNTNFKKFIANFHNDVEYEVEEKQVANDIIDNVTYLIENGCHNTETFSDESDGVVLKIASCTTPH